MNYPSVPYNGSPSEPYREGPSGPYRGPSEPYRGPSETYREGPSEPYREDPSEPYREGPLEPYREPSEPYREPSEPYRGGPTGACIDESDYKLSRSYAQNIRTTISYHYTFNFWKSLCSLIFCPYILAIYILVSADSLTAKDILALNYQKRFKAN